MFNRPMFSSAAQDFSFADVAMMEEDLSSCSIFEVDLTKRRIAKDDIPYAILARLPRNSFAPLGAATDVIRTQCAGSRTKLVIHGLDILSRSPESFIPLSLEVTVLMTRLNELES